MTEHLLLAVAVLVLALALVVVVAAREAQAVLERRTAVRRTVVVSLVDGRAIRGVLWSRRGGLLVLRGAQLLEPSAGPVDMDGEIVIERARVDFVQVVAAS